MNQLQKYSAGLLVGLLSIVGTVQAAVPEAVETTFAAMETDFEAVFALAFPVLATIVLAMIAWRYTRKLGNKL